MGGQAVPVSSGTGRCFKGAPSLRQGRRMRAGWPVLGLPAGDVGKAGRLGPAYVQRWHRLREPARLRDVQTAGEGRASEGVVGRCVAPAAPGYQVLIAGGSTVAVTCPLPEFRASGVGYWRGCGDLQPRNCAVIQIR